MEGTEGIESPAQSAEAARVNQIETIGVLSLVLSQLGETERRIVRKIDDNSAAAVRRWKSHDEEHVELSRAVQQIGDLLEAHLGSERDARLVFDTRMGPVLGLWRFATADKRWLVVFLYIAVQFADDVWTFLHATGLLG